VCVWFDITALLVSGAYKLADTVKKPPPITGDQAVKFANYFLSRRSVQTSKGAYNLLEVVNTLTNNKVLYDCVTIYFSPNCCIC
jgi:oligosaccharyltransferase complex subunit delta (ribophorin II)